MFSLVALVSLFVVALASRCCIPPTWEGRVGFLTGMLRNGKVEMAKGSALMAYDGIRHLIGQREYVDIGSKGQTTIDVLLDFDHDLKWIRQGNECIKTKLNRVWDIGCIPDNATIISLNAELGQGNNSLPVDTYLIDFGGAVQLTVSVSSQGCIPVLEMWRGTLEGVPFMQNSGFVNLTAGLSSPQDLNTPPVGCENAPMVEAHYTQGNFNTNLVGRRSLFGL